MKAEIITELILVLLDGLACLKN